MTGLDVIDRILLRAAKANGCSFFTQETVINPVAKP